MKTKTATATRLLTGEWRVKSSGIEVTMPGWFTKASALAIFKSMTSRKVVREIYKKKLKL